MRLKWILAIASTALVGWVSVAWGMAFAHWPFSALSNSAETQAEIIRRVMPFHLVKPEWVMPSSDGELVMPWLLAETKTRMTLIGLLWLLLMVTIWKMKRKGAGQKHGDIQLPADGLKPSDSKPPIG